MKSSPCWPKQWRKVKSQHLIFIILQHHLMWCQEMMVILFTFERTGFSWPELKMHVYSNVEVFLWILLCTAGTAVQSSIWLLRNLCLGVFSRGLSPKNKYPSTSCLPWWCKNWKGSQWRWFTFRTLKMILPLLQ